MTYKDLHKLVLENQELIPKQLLNKILRLIPGARINNLTKDQKVRKQRAASKSWYSKNREYKNLRVLNQYYIKNREKNLTVFINHHIENVYRLKEKHFNKEK